MTTKRWLALGLAVATVAAVVGDALRTPADALRGARRVVADHAGACAIFDGAPMQCWGATEFVGSWLPYAQSSDRPDATSLASSWTASCVVEHAALDCPAVKGILSRPALRTPRAFTAVRSPVASLSAVCVLARVEGQETEVFCHSLRFLEEDRPPLESDWEPIALGDPTALALGEDTLCGLQRDGRVRCRTLSTTDVYDVVGVTGAVQLASGRDFACARETWGVVRCWGKNGSGQLGDGTYLDHADARPIALPTPAPATDLVARDGRACALVEGRPVCWGEVGLPSAHRPETASRPRRDAEVGGLRQLALGAAFTCALRLDGTVRCWGYDAGGALGNGASLPSPGCHREGISGTSPERERPGGPAVVRTGAAGLFPSGRAALALGIALLVLGPLALAWRSAGAAFRPGEPRDPGARFAVHGAALLWASFVPVCVARVAPALHAAGRYSYDGWELRGSSFQVGFVCLAALLPAILATRLFLSVMRTLARGGDLLRAARRAVAPLGGLGCTTLLLSMAVTPRLNDHAETELVYLLRHATLELRPFFLARWVWTLAWFGLVVAYLIGLQVWSRRMRTWASGARW